MAYLEPWFLYSFVFVAGWGGVCVGVILFKMAPICSANVLSSVPKCKKAMMCLLEKIRMSDKLPSGRGRSACWP